MKLLDENGLRFLWGKITGKISEGLNTKVNVNQGTDNSGKVLQVGEDGNVFLSDELKALRTLLVEIKSILNNAAPAITTVESINELIVSYFEQFKVEEIE